MTQHNFLLPGSTLDFEVIVNPELNQWDSRFSTVIQDHLGRPIETDTAEVMQASL